ncbi:MAG: AmmeMemoRadiSam system protein B [Planctomycetota bacterium]|jgi:AmmeMemoRadiSam system protein B
MANKEGLPRIRMGLDYFPVNHEGQEMICLRDPLQLAPDPILVPPHAFFIVAHMDGSNRIVDIQEAFNHQFGQLIFSNQIEELIDLLDAKGFLDSPAFQGRLSKVESAFRKATLRPSALAGQAYPAEEREVRGLLDDLFDEVPPPSKKQGKRLAGLIAPHIDLHRGGPLFAKAYHALRNTPKPHTALIFGTAHYGEGNLFILTEKAFETPLGVSALDEKFSQALIEGCSFDIRKGELAHRTEHSIEFQVLFLQHIFGKDESPKIVPILCGSLMELLPGHESPLTLPEMKSFLDAVKEAIQACEGPVLVMAGADMCHVGRKFGMSETMTPGFLDRVRQEDRASLTAAVEQDGEAFFRKVAGVENRNNICSVASIYTVLKLLEHCDGELLDYAMAVDEGTDSAVGFAALNLWE